METNDFHALRTGVVEGPDGPCTLTVHDLGTLVLRSGRLEVSDPFAGLGEGVVLEVPPGEYPVRVTVADVSDAQDGSHLREAYLSLVLDDAPTASVEPAHAELVGVDAGTVGLVVADAVRTGMPADPGDWYDQVFDDGSATSWFSVMDAHEPHVAGCANVPLPLATDGANLVLAHSGWGDGAYPLLASLAADGERWTGIHLDLLVASDGGLDDEDDPAPDGPAELIEIGVDPLRAWWARPHHWWHRIRRRG